VDAQDLQAVRENFGRAAGGLGDADHDGDVDVRDLNAVRNYFGAAATVAVANPVSSSMSAVSATRFAVGSAHDAVFGLWTKSPDFEWEKPRRRRDFR
jgi:hypothetical protein